VVNMWSMSGQYVLNKWSICGQILLTPSTPQGCDMLWSGVPLVTLPALKMVSRGRPAAGGPRQTGGAWTSDGATCCGGGSPRVRNVCLQLRVIYIYIRYPSIHTYMYVCIGGYLYVYVRLQLRVCPHRGAAGATRDSSTLGGARCRGAASGPLLRRCVIAPLRASHRDSGREDPHRATDFRAVSLIQGPLLSG
jgi:hypothetical protein